MSYLNYPRIYFSGRFQADPSTINNTPNNFDPSVYPSPNDLDKVELYWNPRGKGGFNLVDCVVTRVDYDANNSATTAAEDSIIGQPVQALIQSFMPLQSALVDLDPMQQNVSEIWGMVLQIGGDDSNLTGKVPNVAFNSIWAQCQGPTAPRSSISGSAVYQAKMSDVTQTGDSSNSQFLSDFSARADKSLSLNFNTNAHNNSPPIYSFNEKTFLEMAAAGVSLDVLKKIEPLKLLFQNSDHSDDGTIIPVDLGDIPTLDFVTYILQQYLSTDEYNASIDNILNTTKQEYAGSTYDFLEGMITGTVGFSTVDDPTYFVPSRLMSPINGSAAFYTPFNVTTNNELSTVTIDLGNSLATVTPGSALYQEKLGDLWLVSFPNGEISISNMNKLAQIPYTDSGFLTEKAGLFTFQSNDDLSQTPLGLLSLNTTINQILLSEDPNGYYMKADQFVYRMNPAFPTTKDFTRGETNTVNIHVYKFGVPVADNTEISFSMMSEQEAINYTIATVGTGGTMGVKNLSIPQSALKPTGENSFPVSANTVGGVATFDITALNPGNPREYVNGQVYFLEYNFPKTPTVATNPAPIAKDINDIVSVMVYGWDTENEIEPAEILAKFGRLYKIMGFLANEDQVFQRRNTIKALLAEPMSEINHMPLTRDLSAEERKRVIAWIDFINTQ